MSFTTLRLLVFSMAAAFLAGPLQACSVPVFRYALERWAADPYQAVVFHRGPLSEAQRATVKNLTEEGLAGQLHANLSVRTVDLDRNPDPAALALWAQSRGETLPYLVVRHPDAQSVPGLLAAEPLADSSLARILDSPARQEIVRRLAGGESVVWTLLEIGDPQRDNEAAKVLENRLAYLTSVLKLPKLDQQDITSDAADHLRLAFSIVRLSRQNAAEQAFVKMLLDSERDLAELAEPMAFPIFGRGRVLYALAGKGINPEHIDRASTFLIGACSCEVKEQNPGVDLLVSADWENLVTSTLAEQTNFPSRAEGGGAAAAVIASLPVAEVPGPAVEVVSFQPPEKTAPARSLPGRTVFLGALIVAVLAAGTFLFRRKT